MINKRTIDKTHKAKLTTIVVAVVVLGVAAFFLNGLRNRASLIDATRVSPSEVSLSANSCNQNPSVEVEQTAPDVYEVVVRTHLPSTGEECADGVTISVDPEQPTLTIVDRTSGDSFELFGTGENGPPGLNGVWRMTTVDNGQVVEVGVTTFSVPGIQIEANDTNGVISGNFGCNELAIDVTFEDRDDVDTGNGGLIVGQPGTLEGTEELCAIPDGSDQVVLTEQSLLELLLGERVEFFQLGDSLEIGNRQTNAVFERIAALPE